MSISNSNCIVVCVNIVVSVYLLCNTGYFKNYDYLRCLVSLLIFIFIVFFLFCLFKISYFFGKRVDTWNPGFLSDTTTLICQTKNFHLFGCTFLLSLLIPFLRYLYIVNSLPNQQQHIYHWCYLPQIISLSQKFLGWVMISPGTKF